MKKHKISIVGFDADDTLWVNEPFFRESEFQFADLFTGYMDRDLVIRELFQIEMKNLELYGYGIKSFMLSMIETAYTITGDAITKETIAKIIEIGREQLQKPVQLLDGVEEVLHKLSSHGYKLIVATKGDLLDQERKLRKSGLEKYFHHIEIMSDKKESDYQKLLSKLDIKASEFIMIGNSLKSDVIPVLNIGGAGIHVPFHTTWQHEEISSDGVNEYIEVESIAGVIPMLIC